MCLTIIHKRPTGVFAYTPAKVDRLVAVERTDVLDDGVARGGITRHASNTYGGIAVVISRRLAAGRSHLHIGSIGEEAHLVTVVADSTATVFVRPVFYGLIGPVVCNKGHQLVVHEVRRCQLVVLLVVSVVTEYTEAAESSSIKSFLNSCVVSHAIGTCTRCAASVGIEAHGTLFEGGFSLGHRAGVQAVVT